MDTKAALRGEAEGQTMLYVVWTFYWSLLGKLVKTAWANMIELPWKHSGATDTRGIHWLFWLSGWVWSVSGLMLGALYAPTVVRIAGLSNTQYQDWLVIAFAVGVGFLVQFFGWALFSGAEMGIAGIAAMTIFRAPISAVISDSDPDTMAQNLSRDKSFVFGVTHPLVLLGAFYIGGMLSAVAPIIGVGYGIYLFFTAVAVDQRVITIAFVGGLLFKTFVVPLLHAIMVGFVYKRVVPWIRGSKDAAQSPTHQPDRETTASDAQ